MPYTRYKKSISIFWEPPKVVSRKHQSYKVRLWRTRSELQFSAGW